MALNQDRLSSPEKRNRPDWAALKIVGIFGLFVCFGLWFFFSGKEVVSSDESVVKSAPPSPRDPDARINPAVKPPINR